jgi:hypothetical protein
MAVLTRVDVNEGGQGLAAGGAACTGGGDSVVNDGRTVLVVKNGDASPHSVTVTPAKATTQQDGLGALTKAAITVAVAAGDVAVIGPFAPALFNDINGKIAITYTAVTSMTIMAVRVAKV